MVSRNAAASAGSRGTGGGGGGPSEWLTPHPASIAAARATASCLLRVMQGEYRCGPRMRATGGVHRQTRRRVVCRLKCHSEGERHEPGGLARSAEHVVVACFNKDPRLASYLHCEAGSSGHPRSHRALGTGVLVQVVGPTARD